MNRLPVKLLCYFTAHEFKNNVDRKTDRYISEDKYEYKFY